VAKSAPDWRERGILTGKTQDLMWISQLLKKPEKQA
jgi:hypothetical protein